MGRPDRSAVGNGSGQEGHRAGSIESRFCVLRNRTACPYARGATILYAPEWCSDLGIEENARGWGERLQSEMTRSDEPWFDMFVMEIRSDPAVDSVRGMAHALYVTLGTLAGCDTNGPKPFTRGILRPEWDFRLFGERFFVPVFAPFYPSHHPRCSQVGGSAFVVLQPDACFRRKGISSSSRTRKQLTDDVAKLFLDRGFSYDIELVTHPLKAARYLKPVSWGDAPVRWWEPHLDP